MERVRRNPMYRAFRADKLIIQALQTSLLHLLKQEWEAIPTLRMISEPLDAVQMRAERIALGIPNAAVVASEGAVGGGATPDQVMASYAVEITVENVSKLERALRRNVPPILGRIERGRWLLDCRTVQESEVDLVRLALLGGDRLAGISEAWQTEGEWLLL